MSNSQKGFGSMDKDLQRKIASSGGRMAWKVGKAHKFTTAEAKVAGALGGKVMQARRRAALAKKGS